MLTCEGCNIFFKEICFLKKELLNQKKQNSAFMSIIRRAFFLLEAKVAPHKMEIEDLVCAFNQAKRLAKHEKRRSIPRNA